MEKKILNTILLDETVIEKIPVIEFTSSGLSHTFTKVTARSKSSQKQAIDVTQKIQQRSRGYFIEFLSGLYQVSSFFMFATLRILFF